MPLIAVFPLFGPFLAGGHCYYCYSLGVGESLLGGAIYERSREAKTDVQKKFEKQMFLERDVCQPFPATKSWQTSFCSCIFDTTYCILHTKGRLPAFC